MNIQEFINPELLWLIPVLLVVGAWLKNIPRIPDWLIPIINTGVAILFCMMYTIGTTEGAFFMAVYTGLAQGLLIGTSAGGTHQLYKQITHK